MKNRIFLLLCILMVINVYAKNFVTGVVTDMSNTPIANTRVIIGNYSEGSVYSNPIITFTDKDGKYLVKDIIPGLQSIECEKISYRFFGDTVVLNKGSNIYNIKLEQEFDNKNTPFFDVEDKPRDWEMSGKIFCESTGDPIKDAYVVYGKNITRSLENGSFKIYPENGEEDFLIISVPKYDIYQQKLRPKRNQTIKLSLKVPYNEIFGRVISQENFEPVSNIDVKIGEKTVRTDGKGLYFLKNMPTGEYPILVDSQNYKKYSDVINIYKGKQNYDIILKEKKKYGYVYGYIKKRSNLKPLANALVAIGTISIKTDEDGFYELHGVLAKKSEIVVIFNNKEIYRSGIWVQEGKQQNDIVY